MAIESSARCSVMTQKGGTGREVGERFKREGIYVYLQLIPVFVWQKSAQHCKAIILQFKIKKPKERRSGRQMGTM